MSKPRAAAIEDDRGLGGAREVHLRLVVASCDVAQDERDKDLEPARWCDRCI
jgi:hypothetical protein